MSLLIVSGIVGLSVGIFFLLISIFSKKEDYLLDDYSVEDAPDNVRIIEREIPKIIEKEVIKEVPKIVDRIVEKEIIVEKVVTVTDTKEIERLSRELNDVTEEKISIHNELEKIGIDSKEEIDKKESEIKVINEKINTLLSEKKEVDDKLKESDENNVSVINKLKKEKTNIELKLVEVEKNRKGYKELFKKTKKELTDAVDDRDHFYKVIEKKDVDIKRLKSDINTSNIKHPYVYEGIDEYGKFFDVYSDTTGIVNKKLMKIREISENLEPTQFAYYATIDTNNFENVHIGQIIEVESFIKKHKLKEKETNGKYEVFIIFSNRVYPFKLH